MPEDHYAPPESDYAAAADARPLLWWFLNWAAVFLGAGAGFVLGRVADRALIEAGLLRSEAVAQTLLLMVVRMVSCGVVAGVTTTIAAREPRITLAIYSGAILGVLQLGAGLAELHAQGRWADATAPALIAGGVGLLAPLVAGSLLGGLLGRRLRGREGWGK